ncbi:hypothetical protein B19861_08500 [Bifidobacterium adolescentis]|uniref:ABC transporter permease n=1 Tax=Bifidobacterium adolescentis TaxID=1680 RepID=A0ABM8IRZ8_BIFAD|nr:hypothetical protein B19861_08500 [Bifidobacterium faecale]
MGSFALVGLKVTGPDMQATAADFYGRNNLADITVVSNYGISKDDERIIGKADGIKEVEYGYFKDVAISGTDRSMRIYSKPDAVSTYDVTEGRLPKRTGEIALDMKERDRFAVGSTLNVTEKTDIAGGTVLRHHKFTVYGFAASTLGTCIGVLAGHTLLPLIVAHAYSAGFTMPDIMLKFHPWITMAAFALAWISAVVPAWLAASKELREKPASLLLPKPPAKGSKILLEHFPPLWNRLNFTHKVTARNIFRYKTRMFMTIFGVCGAVSLLTAGLAVQSSIGQIGNRQFEELIHYDLIVAEESDTNSAQREEIATTLKGKTVQSSTAVRYEELSKTAGKKNDKQSITLLATDDAYNFNEYLTLRDRKTHQPQILVNNGAVISERLAEMLNVSVGDTFTVNDENGAQRTIKVAGISEMYIGHFIFMNAQCYEHVFGDQYSTNAYMVRLKDHSNANTERQGAKFMKLAAVRGVVQNTTQKNMVSTIVGSLNQIMEVLILVAVLLAVVILYDLTNLNVSERIRELSTIKVLGFHTSETTMYIYRETILLSLLGILAGYGFGEWLHRYIITEVPPDEVMFDPAISWIALAAPAIVVAVVLAVLGWIVYRQLETVDMLEALKSVE